MPYSNEQKKALLERMGFRNVDLSDTQKTNAMIEYYAETVAGGKYADNTPIFTSRNSRIDQEKLFSNIELNLATTSLPTTLVDNAKFERKYPAITEAGNPNLVDDKRLVNTILIQELGIRTISTNIDRDQFIEAVGKLDIPPEAKSQAGNVFDGMNTQGGTVSPTEFAAFLDAPPPPTRVLRPKTPAEEIRDAFNEKKAAIANGTYVSPSRPTPTQPRVETVAIEAEDVEIIAGESAPAPAAAPTPSSVRTGIAGLKQTSGSTLFDQTVTKKNPTATAYNLDEFEGKEHKIGRIDLPPEVAGAAEQQARFMLAQYDKGVNANKGKPKSEQSKPPFADTLEELGITQELSAAPSENRKKILASSLLAASMVGSAQDGTVTFDNDLTDGEGVDSKALKTPKGRELYNQLRAEIGQKEFGLQAPKPERPEPRTEQPAAQAKPERQTPSDARTERRTPPAASDDQEASTDERQETSQTAKTMEVFKKLGAVFVEMFFAIAKFMEIMSKGAEETGQTGPNAPAPAKAPSTPTTPVPDRSTTPTTEVVATRDGKEVRGTVVTDANGNRTFQQKGPIADVTIDDRKPIPITDTPTPATSISERPLEPRPTMPQNVIIDARNAVAPLTPEQQRYVTNEMNLELSNAYNGNLVPTSTVKGQVQLSGGPDLS